MNDGMKQIMDNLRELELGEELALLDDIMTLLVQMTEGDPYNGRLAMVGLVNGKKYSLEFKEIQSNAKD